MSMKKILLSALLAVVVASIAAAIDPKPVLDPNQTYSVSEIYKDVHAEDEHTGRLTNDGFTTFNDPILSVYVANATTNSDIQGNVHVKSLNSGKERSVGFYVYPGSCPLCGRFYGPEPDPGVISQNPKPTYDWKAEIVVHYPNDFLPTKVYWVYRFRGV